MNYKIVMEYEGTHYKGWQRQLSTQNTIQGVLENAIFEATGETVEVNGSGRTDAGVHALGQTANFRLKNNYDELMDIINAKLPADIRIISCKPASERFHARLNVKSKTYCYKIDTSPKMNVFTRRTINHFCCELDIEKMRLAAERLIGFHDFRAFCANKRMKKSTERNLYSIDIVQNGSEISFIYRGNGFLYNMVRILTGTIIEVGMGKMQPEDMDDILASLDRSRAGMTMPARGLTLVSVEY